MKKQLILLVAGLSVLSGAILFFARLYYHTPGSDSSKRVSINTVETTPPELRNFSVRIRWFGTVESRKRVEIKPVRDGQIVAIRVKDGADVKLNEPLFVLGGEIAAHEREILKKQVSSLENQVSLMKDVVKSRSYSTSKKLTTKEDLFTAEAGLSALQASLSTERQHLASLDDSLLIRSPIAGIFTDRLVSQGQYVTKGTPLADIISKDLRIVARLFPPAGVNLAGKRAFVRSALGENATGVISAVLPRQTAAGATEVWIEGKEINNTMRPGEAVSGWVVMKKYAALAVPQEAVLRDDQGQTFVVLETGQGYRRARVGTGPVQNGWCEIVAGVASTDNVVTSGAYEIFNRDFSIKYKLLD